MATSVVPEAAEKGLSKDAANNQTSLKIFSSTCRINIQAGAAVLCHFKES